MAKAKLVEAFGEARTVAEWSEFVGISVATLRCRLRRGLSAEDALTAPAYEPSERGAGILYETTFQPSQAVEVGGVERTVAEWCALHDLTPQQVKNRLRNGYTLARAVSMPRPGPPRLTAHGVTLTIDEWAERTGIPRGTLLSRQRTMRSGRHEWTDERIVSTPYTATNKPQAPKYEVEPGSPGSISWEIEPWETDPTVRAFVAAHPDGATVDRVCEATGLHDSQCRQIEQNALRKLRARALSGDADAVRFISALTGDDRDVEELLDIMAAKFPGCDPDQAEPADAMDAELVSLDELEGEPDNDNGMDEELAQLGYASGWA